MNSIKQMCVALIGSLLLLICITGVGLAEGEAPPPPSAGDTSDVALESSSQPINANPDAKPDAETDTEADTATATDEVADVDVSARSRADTKSTPKSLPKPKPWLQVVNSLRPGYWEASTLPVQGLAMYYNPGVFRRVLNFRHEHDHVSQCEECIGYVALLRGGDIDRRVWLQREGEILEGPFWVVDAAAFQHIPGLLSRNWVVDVDHDTAMRWRMAGPIPITVYDADSPEAKAVIAAQASAAQTVAVMELVYQCAIVPVASYDYHLLNVLATSATCLTSQQANPVNGSVDAETTSN